jgi:hypothetical protein
MIPTPDKPKTLPPSFAPKAYDSNTITSVKDEEEETYTDMIRDAFMDTLPHKRNMLLFRAQYQGIDPFINETYKAVPGQPYHKQMPRITSMLTFKCCNIISSRYFQALVSSSGEYVKGMPQARGKVEKAKAVTTLTNHYLRKDDYLNYKFYEIFRGAAVDGVAVSKQYWNYQTSLIDNPRDLRTKLNPITGKIELGEKRKKRILVADRPELDYVDPLFFALPKGHKFINRLGGASRCFHKELFYRYELEELEEWGYVKGVAGKTQAEIGGTHSNDLESSEMRQFYTELFDDYVNERIPFESPYYRFWIDKVFEKATPNSPPMELWFVNGHLIRKGVWKGGFELPYETHVHIPSFTSWIGIAVPEINQDNYRELNEILRNNADVVGQASRPILMYPKSMGLKQSDLDKMKKGIPVEYNDLDPTVTKDKIFYQQRPDLTTSSLEHRDYYNKQSLEDLGIAIGEAAIADLPSAMRSGKLLQGLTGQSGKQGAVTVSLMAESIKRVFNRMKIMTYALQNQPVEIMINPLTQETLKIGEDEFDVFPDVELYPNINLEQLGSEALQLFGQFIPMLQGAIDIPSYVKLLMELGATPEAARRFEEILPLPASPIGGGQSMAKPKQPVGSPGM